MLAVPVNVDGSLLIAKILQNSVTTSLVLMNNEHQGVEPSPFNMYSISGDS